MANFQRFEGTVGLPPPEQEETTDIYEKYNFSHHLQADRLPIEDHKNEILNTVRHNNVLVLRGPTGCGKTTKVPQFILDDSRQRGKHCNIVVAQPRRIAASSNAKRVCRERGWECGTIVGFQVCCTMHITIYNQTFSMRILNRNFHLELGWI